MAWRFRLAPSLGLVLTLPLALAANEYYSSSANLAFVGLRVSDAPWQQPVQTVGSPETSTRHLLIQLSHLNENCTTSAFELMVTGYGEGNLVPLLQVHSLGNGVGPGLESLELIHGEPFGSYLVRVVLDAPLAAGESSPGLRIDMEPDDALPTGCFLRVSEDGINFGNLSALLAEPMAPRPRIDGIVYLGAELGLDFSRLAPGLMYHLERSVAPTGQPWLPVLDFSGQPDMWEHDVVIPISGERGIYRLQAVSP